MQAMAVQVCWSEEGEIYFLDEVRRVPHMHHASHHSLDDASKQMDMLSPQQECQEWITLKSSTDQRLCAISLVKLFWHDRSLGTLVSAE